MVSRTGDTTPYVSSRVYGHSRCLYGYTPVTAPRMPVAATTTLSGIITRQPAVLVPVATLGGSDRARSPPLPPTRALDHDHDPHQHPLVGGTTKEIYFMSKWRVVLPGQQIHDVPDSLVSLIFDSKYLLTPESAIEEATKVIPALDGILDVKLVWAEES